MNKKTILMCVIGLAVGALTGCGGMAQSDHEVATTVWAVGIPGVAILHDTRINPDNRGTAQMDASQTNTVDVDAPIK